MENAQQQRDELINELDWLIQELEYGARQSLVVSPDTLIKLAQIKKELYHWEPEEMVCKNCDKWEQFEDLNFDSGDYATFRRNVGFEDSPEVIMDEVYEIIKEKIG